MLEISITMASKILPLGQAKLFPKLEMLTSYMVEALSLFLGAFQVLMHLT